MESKGDGFKGRLRGVSGVPGGSIRESMEYQGFYKGSRRFRGITDIQGGTRGFHGRFRKFKGVPGGLRGI